VSNPYIVVEQPSSPPGQVMAQAPAAQGHKVKPLLFIPLGRDVVRDSWVFNCLADIVGQGWPRIKTEANATDIQRNQGADALLKAPPEFNALVMLDSDHRHPPETVRMLCNALESMPDAGMIVGLNFRRRQPYDPCVWVKRGEQVYQPVQWDQGLIGPVYRTGMAAVIIPRRTFELVPRPWFANTYSVAPDEIVYKREDFYFCDRVREAGLNIWVDTRITAPHEPNLPGWVDGGWWRAYLEKHPNLVAETLPQEG
jgi:hypothetical protein